MVDVFFPGAWVEDEAELQVLHEEQVVEAQRMCRITLSGPLSAQAQISEQVQADRVEDKRLHKRQVKLALYHALKDATGQHPPWGALTGIRPTRLIYEQMSLGMDLAQAQGFMTDVFDLWPENAALTADVVATQQGSPQPKADEIDIYIGIPFCPTRCRYCSFISMQLGDGKLAAPYTEALIKEIHAANDLLKETGLKPRAFYMGGGTPTTLSADALRQVLSAAQPLMGNAVERTVEAGRPDSMTRDKLIAIREAGVERISVNPQTAHDETLRAIGRAHTKEDTERAFKLAREIGFTNINMDLIAGLPGEDSAMFDATLDWVKRLAPESLTVHSLCVKRSSDMHRLMDSLPDGGEVARMVQMGRAAAQAMGMRPYYLYRQKHMAGNQANVGYALPDKACLYNIDTMEDHLSVLALGAGGISKKVTKGRALVKRAANVKEVRFYIDRVDEMIGRKKDLFTTKG